MRAHFGLLSIKRDEADASNKGIGSGMGISCKKPIRVKFKILRVLFIQVRYLKIIERSGYQALP